MAAAVSDDSYERVRHPKHYNSHPSGIEAWDIIEEFTFNIGTAIKHVWRHGLKPGSDVIEDIDKAIQYLEREKIRLLKRQALDEIHCAVDETALDIHKILTEDPDDITARRVEDLEEQKEESWGGPDEARDPSS